MGRIDSESHFLFLLAGGYATCSFAVASLDKVWFRLAIPGQEPPPFPPGTVCNASVFLSRCDRVFRLRRETFRSATKSSRSTARAPKT